MSAALAQAIERLLADSGAGARALSSVHARRVPRKSWRRGLAELYGGSSGACHRERRAVRLPGDERRTRTYKPEPARARADAGPGVEIGPDVSFGAYVVVHAGTVIGAGCVIEDHAVLGKHPRLAPGLLRGG